MLRSIYQAGRKRLVIAATNSESSNSGDGTASSSTDETLEPWSDWVKKVTYEIEGHFQKAQLEDWLRCRWRKQFRWVGHILRRTDGRWSYKLLLWQPEHGPQQGGTGRGRRQARPFRRWDDALLHFFETRGLFDWNQIQIEASNRIMWRTLEDAFVQFAEDHF